MDDTIFFDHNKAVIRVILKNNKRETIMASSLLENEVYNPEAIETLVIEDYNYVRTKAYQKSL